MRKLLLSVAVIALTAPLAFAAPAEGDAPREGDRPRERRAEGERGPRGGGIAGALRHLDLTDDQKAQIKVILDETREASKAYREANAETHKKLMGDLKAAREAKDEDAAKAVHAELRKLHEASPMFAAHAKIMAVLTDEQRAKLEERRERRPDGEERPGRRPGGRERGGDKDAPAEG